MGRNIAVTVHGKVQGVWFRHFTMKEAVRLGLHGYVTNREDGSVYIEASGQIDKINLFLQWCQKGSPLSEVDRIEVFESDIIHNAGFQIKR